MTTLKESYADQWQAGNARERYVRALLELVGYTVEPFGFMAESDIFNPTQNSEVGKPDYELTVPPDTAGPNGESYPLTTTVAYVEVTGTDRLKEPMVWVRPDKVRWAKSNPAPRTYLAFVENHKAGMVRWLHMVYAEAYEVKEVNLGKGPELYHQVPVDQFMTTKQFLADLQGKGPK